MGSRGRVVVWNAKDDETRELFVGYVQRFCDKTANFNSTALVKHQVHVMLLSYSSMVGRIVIKNWHNGGATLSLTAGEELWDTSMELEIRSSV